MAKQTTKSGKLGDMQRLLAALAANGTDLTFLEASRTRFGELVAKAQEVAKTQDALTASKQEASKQLQALMADAQRLANVLRLSVKQHYGIRAEKLAEFGLQPFRGRAKKVTTPETPGSPGATPTSTPTPTPSPTAPIPAHPVPATPTPTPPHPEPAQ